MSVRYMPSGQPAPTYMTPQEVALYLRHEATSEHPRRQFNEYARVIPRIRRGNTYVYHIDDVDEYMERLRKVQA